jgi:uncharacterized Ntn-hydrolase superfamily protein
MTYSIVAKDPDTGQLAVAVASRFFAVGALAPHVRGGKCAVATQAFVNPVWGIEAADRMAQGEPAAAVLADLVARDNGRDQRQIHMIDAAGRSVAHTGKACIDWCGHLIGDGVSVAGNMLAGAGVVADTLAAYQSHMHLPFAERLMTAMEAGERAGGDKRGKQSAALRIHRGEDYPWIDIRADDHSDPLDELRRLYDVAHDRYMWFSDGLATRTNFSGVSDRRGIDDAIAAEEARRKTEGRASRSYATEA